MLFDEKERTKEGRKEGRRGRKRGRKKILFSSARYYYHVSASGIQLKGEQKAACSNEAG